jgi:hypothetical protein
MDVFAQLSPIAIGLSCNTNMDADPELMVGLDNFQLDVGCESDVADDDSGTSSSDSDVSLSSQVKRATYTSDVDSSLLELHAVLGSQWRLIRSLLRETHAEFNASSDALRNRHNRLTIRKNCPQPAGRRLQAARPIRCSWGEEEDRLLFTAFEGSERRASWQSVAAMLPRRTAHASRNRVARLSEQCSG